MNKNENLFWITCIQYLYGFILSIYGVITIAVFNIESIVLGIIMLIFGALMITCGYCVSSGKSWSWWMSLIIILLMLFTQKSVNILWIAIDSYLIYSLFTIEAMTFCNVSKNRKIKIFIVISIIILYICYLFYLTFNIFKLQIINCTL